MIMTDEQFLEIYKPDYDENDYYKFSERVSIKVESGTRQFKAQQEAFELLEGEHEL